MAYGLKVFSCDPLKHLDIRENQWSVYCQIHAIIFNYPNSTVKLTVPNDIGWQKMWKGFKIKFVRSTMKQILETLRFSGLNERNVSLVTFCAVILVMQRLSSKATACPDTRCARSTRAWPEGGYIVFSM